LVSPEPEMSNNNYRDITETHIRIYMSESRSSIIQVNMYSLFDSSIDAVSFFREDDYYDHGKMS
jgi:hypothetical protein